MKFELFQDASSEWRWRRIASNKVDIGCRLRSTRSRLKAAA
jgi:hypothetical protein